MNLLAHTYLSGRSEEIKIGNFIGDFIKGNDYNKYPVQIKKGIIYHREIDDFTDRHEIVKQSKQRLKSEYHKYSGIIVDIFYDHFLAKNWDYYSATPLNEFSSQFYSLLTKNYSILPLKAKQILPSLIENNWFVLYSSIEGIERALNGMERRTSLPQKKQFAIKILDNNYNLFEKEFIDFFKQTITHFENKLKINIKNL